MSLENETVADGALIDRETVPVLRESVRDVERLGEEVTVAAREHAGVLAIPNMRITRLIETRNVLIYKNAREETKKKYNKNGCLVKNALNLEKNFGG